MAKHKVYYLKTQPQTRFHFGEMASESSLSSTSVIPHSDTLTGAIFSNAYLKDVTLADKLKEALANGKIQLSSGGIFIENSESKILFFAKPLVLDTFKMNEDANANNKQGDSKTNLAKKIKKVQFISKGIWEKGFLPNDWVNTEKCTLAQKGKFVCLKEEAEKLNLTYDEKLYEMTDTPKVPITYTDNHDNDQKIYTQVDVFLNGKKTEFSEIDGKGLNTVYDTGYFFLLQHDLEDDLARFFDDAVQTICTMGLGGDRSTGAGHITEIKSEEFEWEMAISDKTTWCNLSVLIPKEDDQEYYKIGRYRMLLRGGQNLGQDQSLKVIQSIKEGGLFEKKIDGRAVELKHSALANNRVINGWSYFAPSKYKMNYE